MYSRNQKFIKEIFSSLRSLLFSGIIGISSGFLVYLGFLQRHFFSVQYILYSGLITVSTTLIVAWLINKSLKRKFLSLPNRIRIFLVIFTFAFSIIILLNIQIQPIYNLLPDEHIRIILAENDSELENQEIYLLWIKTGQGYVHHSSMDIQGSWYKEDTVLVFPVDQEVIIDWTGKAGPYAEIVFEKTDFTQKILIEWDEEMTVFDLNRQDLPTVEIIKNYKLSIFHQLPFIIAFMIAAGFLIFSFLILLGSWTPLAKKDCNKKQLNWLLFSLPMIICWIFTLLVFWPGVLSNDSFDLWGQAYSGDFNDWQSAFYAIILSFLIEIIYSPAFILVLQILFFSIIVALGLGKLYKIGVSKIVLWLISFLFAVSPLNNMQVITLWKDIPYAVFFLWLTIIMLEIFYTDGNWIQRRKNILLLAVVAFSISIFRQNGVPITFLTLIVAAIVYKKYWKQFFISIFLFTFLFILTKGPIYDLMKVDRSISGQSNLILLHHMAAHLDQETSFHQSELNYLETFLPLSEWDYSCCYMGPIYFQKDFKKELFLTSSRENRRLTINLFIRDPIVDIEHLLCAGEMAWRFEHNRCYMKSTHGFYSWFEGNTGWIGENDFGLNQDSKFADLVQPYADYLRNFGFLDEMLVFFLKPAFYFYLSILLIGVVYIRSKNWKIVLIGVPVIFQTLLLLLINFAPVFRYFYGTYLVGLFSIGLAFLPVNRNVPNFRDNGI